MKDIKQSDRRDFLQHSILGAAGAGLAIASTTRAAVGDEAEQKRPIAFDVDDKVTNKVDALVVGGRSESITAAIQSARAEKLIEFINKAWNINMEI